VPDSDSCLCTAVPPKHHVAVVIPLIVLIVCAIAPELWRAYTTLKHVGQPVLEYLTSKHVWMAPLWVGQPYLVAIITYALLSRRKDRSGVGSRKG